MGSPPTDSVGRRKDMSELYIMINAGLSDAEILAQNQDYILQIDKLAKLRTLLLTEKYKEKVRLDLEVIYISGATGTGKTRYVLETHGYSNVYRVTDYDHPFDGYACQPVICFDEYRSSLRLKDCSAIWYLPNQNSPPDTQTNTRVTKKSILFLTGL